MSRPEEQIIARLALVGLEISGITAAWPLSTVAASTYTPCLYAFPSTASGFSVQSGAMHWEWNVGWRLLVKPFLQGVEGVDEGSSHLKESLPFLSGIPAHLMAHPRLHTATLPGLSYIKQITCQHGGPSLRQAPDGVICLAVDFTIVFSLAVAQAEIVEPV